MHACRTAIGVYCAARKVSGSLLGFQLRVTSAEFLTLVLWACLMGRFSNAELRKFRDTSRCSACVHYSGCQIWLALLLMNDELAAPGLDIIVPDITKACPMFFPWSSQSARSATRSSGGSSLRRN